MDSLNVIVKRLKKVNLEALVNEVEMLDKMHHHYPNLCEYQLLENGKLVGFTMKFFKGMKWQKLMSDKNSIFHKNTI